MKQREHNLKRYLRNRLKPHEFGMLENTLNIILRNRAIKRDWRQLKGEIGSKRAAEQLAMQYFLSRDQIEFIVYNKRMKPETGQQQ